MHVVKAQVNDGNTNTLHIVVHGAFVRNDTVTTRIGRSDELGNLEPQVVRGGGLGKGDLVLSGLQNTINVTEGSRGGFQGCVTQVLVGEGEVLLRLRRAEERTFRFWRANWYKSNRKGAG